MSTVYINSTAYTVNVNTPFPWTQISYVGVRGDLNNTFYVSYFGITPAPYGGVEQFVNNVESTSWKIYPYWEKGELVMNSTGASNGGQYIAWRYSPVSNTINITIHVTSFPSSNANPGIDIFSANPSTAYDFQSGNYYWLAIQWSGAYQYETPTSGQTTLISSSSIPNLMGKVFTETVILTENSAGNITISQIYVNGTLYSFPDINIPFPWNKIYWIGIRGDVGNLFYVSYFGITQLLSAYSLVTNPTTNTPYTGTVYVAVFPYPISYDVYVSPAPIVNSQTPLPMFSPSFTLTTTLYQVMSSGTVNVIPSIGAWNSTNVPLFLTTLAVGNQIYANIPMVESTGWKIYPYWENGELILDGAGASTAGQYIGWRVSLISNEINVTMHVTSWYVAGGNPAIDIASPNLGDLPTDNQFGGWYGIQISWYGGLSYFIYPNGSYSSFSTPSANYPYPFTFTIILTESSNGYVDLQSIYINSTLYTMNKILPMPWQDIGIFAIRLGIPGSYTFVSYFGVNSIPLVSSSGVTSFNFYSPFSLSYTITNTSITVQNTQLVDGENYLIVPGTNGIIGASFAFYNVTYNVPVLAVSSSPISVTYNAQTLTFTVISASQSFVISPFGVPEQSYQSLTGGVVILPKSEKVTFYANYQPNLVSSSNVSSPPPILVSSSNVSSSSSTTTPINITTTTTTINPNQASVVINGSVYLTAPWLVHYSISSVNSSVTAYLVYNYSVNRPELVLSSPTNVNVNVTFTASNGTALLSESVTSPNTVTLPMTTGNVTVKTTNSTVTIPLTYQRFTVISLTNAIAKSPFLGATAILTLFFVSFFIGFVFRTIPNSMALGSVVYITAVAPFLLAIGLPMSIVLLTVVLAVVALIYSVWALRVTNVP